jgi:hypothetical protein
VIAGTNRRIATTHSQLRRTDRAEVALGYSKQFWLHVPIGVAMFGGLIRQISWLDSLSSDRSSIS